MWSSFVSSILFFLNNLLDVRMVAKINIFDKDGIDNTPENTEKCAAEDENMSNGCLESNWFRHMQT